MCGSSDEHGEPLPGRHGEPVVRQRRARARRDRRRGRGPDARARHVPDVRGLREPSGASSSPAVSPRSRRCRGRRCSWPAAAATRSTRRPRCPVSTSSRTGEPDRTVLISREYAYHGTHGFGTALGGMPANRLAAPFVPDVVRVAYDDPAALESGARTDRAGAGGRVLRGAGDRRRRGAAPASGLRRAGPRDLQPARRVARGRQRDLRVRTTRRLVRRRPLRRRPRPRRLRQGRDQRVPAARWSGGP